MARAKWGKSQKISHTYGKTEKFSSNELPRSSSSVKAESQTTPTRHVRANKRPCKCGSTSHSRINHQDCPLNNKRKTTTAFASAHDSVDDQRVNHHSRPTSHRDLENTAIPGAHDSFDEDDDVDQRTSHRDLENTAIPGAYDSFGDDVDQCTSHDDLEKPAISSENDSFDEDGDDNHHSGDPSAAHDSFDDYFSEDETEAESDMEDLSSDDDQLSCNCPNGYRGTHKQDCHLNPRYKGAKLFRSLYTTPNEPTSSKSSQCELVDVSNSSYQPSGPLPSPDWKQCACEMVKQWSGVSLTSEEEPVKAVKCIEILPHVRDSIVGDGHCLFRALSKEVTGTQKIIEVCVLLLKTF